MTTAERIKDTADYFGLTLSEYDKQKLESIWKVEPVIKEVEKIKYVTKEVEKIVYEAYPLKLLKQKRGDKYELFTNLKEICAEHSIHFSRCFIDDRRKKTVDAKVHFARFMKLKHDEIQDSDIADFLGCDRSTVMYYWYESARDAPLPKLSPKTGEKQTATIDKIKREFKKTA